MTKKNLKNCTRKLITLQKLTKVPYKHIKFQIPTYEGLVILKRQGNGYVNDRITQGIQGAFKKLLSIHNILALIYTVGLVIIAMTVVSVMTKPVYGRQEQLH